MPGPFSTPLLLSQRINHVGQLYLLTAQDALSLYSSTPILGSLFRGISIFQGSILHAG